MRVHALEPGAFLRLLEGLPHRKLGLVFLVHRIDRTNLVLLHIKVVNDLHELIGPFLLSLRLVAKTLYLL